jgi:hypothetical protein
MQRMHCMHCGCNNHNIENCYHIAKPKCPICNRIGHKEEKCRFKKKTQKPRRQKDKLVNDTIAPNAPKKQSNIAEIGSDEETLAAVRNEDPMMNDDPLIDNLYDYNVRFANVATNTDDHLYDWLADTGSTNHITYRCELFSTYEPTLGVTVHGVGGKITQVAGRGTIILTTQYGMRKHTLRLEKVNHIPNNKYNIFALGRWDSQGQRYQASNGELTLYNRNNIPILQGCKIASNIYKFILAPTDASTETNHQIYTFSCNKTKQSWETWHRCFRHVSYKGLRQLHDKQLLDGFTIDTKTTTPNCTSCTEAKQLQKPFDTRNDPA